MKIHPSRAVQYVCTLLFVAAVLFYQYRSIDTTTYVQSVTKHDENLNGTETLQQDGVVARAYTWNKGVPCFPPDAPMKLKDGFRQPARNGILFVKLIKVGGSTATGVTMNIAKHEAERRHEKYWICRGRWDHSWASTMLQNRVRSESFTWTVVRDPTSRVISEFFHFQVSRNNVSPSDKNFLDFLTNKRNAEKFRNLYLRMLSLDMKYGIFDDDGPSVINAILGDYDFIGITERMDESVVALSMLLGVPLGDVLYLNAKGHGGYDDGVYNDKCFFIEPSIVSPNMSAFFKSDYWNEIIKWDRLLYKLANRSLDLTIDDLGRDIFDQNLAKFRSINQAAKDRCIPRNVFPCTATGEHNKNKSCLWSDSGCGYKCLDEIANELGIA
jgi:hypothetical protein